VDGYGQQSVDGKVDVPFNRTLATLEYKKELYKEISTQLFNNIYKEQLDRMEKSELREQLQEVLKATQYLLKTTRKEMQPEDAKKNEELYSYLKTFPLDPSDQQLKELEAALTEFERVIMPYIDKWQTEKVHILLDAEAWYKVIQEKLKEK
jgi:hypothetical protein